jgi:virulence-associated protein VagC
MTPNKPFIRLHGVWLLAAGFQVSDEIDVHVHDKQLVIYPVSRLVARREVHVEQRQDFISHSAELSGPISDRIIWTESDEAYTNL